MLSRTLTALPWNVGGDQKFLADSHTVSLTRLFDWQAAAKPKFTFPLENNEGEKTLKQLKVHENLIDLSAKSVLSPWRWRLCNSVNSGWRGRCRLAVSAAVRTRCRNSCFISSPCILNPACAKSRGRRTCPHDFMFPAQEPCPLSPQVFFGTALRAWRTAAVGSGPAPTPRFWQQPRWRGRKLQGGTSREPQL